MKGDKVIVRTYGNQPIVCRVWDVTSEIVAVCSEENYGALLGGKTGLWPVGIPREDVYRYNPKIDLGRPFSWDRLNTYV